MLSFSSTILRHASRRTFMTSSIFNLSVGEKVPDVIVFEETPGGKVNLGELFAGKKGVLFGVPGAFTPGCSMTHVPGYLQNLDALKAKGVDLVACVAVNDPFVMKAWGDNQGATGKIRMLADTCGDFTKAAGLELDLAAVLGNVRCKRFAMVVEDGVVTGMEVEPDGTGLSCSLAPAVLGKL
jgi:2-Cys peroxiredoxin 5